MKGNAIRRNGTDDPDTGTNNLQNFPVITLAARSNTTGVTTITGTLNSNPNEDFTIQFFLGAATRTTNANRNVGFAFGTSGP